MSENAPSPVGVLCVGETMGVVTTSDASPVVTGTSFLLETGGAESNVAAHLATLGDEAAWFSALGADAVGERILRRLRAAGVDVSLVEVRAGERTGLYVKDPGNGVVYYRAGSAASRLNADDARAIPVERFRVLHLSGITPALSPSCREFASVLIERAREAGVLVSFDVNHRAALWPDLQTASDVLREFAERADICFVGLDEAQGLWDVETPADVRALLSEVRILVVKDGPIGATEFDGESETFVATPPVEVVEPVGAGDAYASGWLHGFLAGQPAEERLLTGHVRAARTLRSAGDLPDDIPRG